MVGGTGPFEHLKKHVSISSYDIHPQMSITWYLHLPERPELPERPPKYRKDQKNNREDLIDDYNKKYMLFIIS